MFPHPFITYAFCSVTILISYKKTFPWMPFILFANIIHSVVKLAVTETCKRWLPGYRERQTKETQEGKCNKASPATNGTTHTWNTNPHAYICTYIEFTHIVCMHRGLPQGWCCSNQLLLLLLCVWTFLKGQDNKSISFIVWRFDDDDGYYCSQDFQKTLSSPSGLVWCFCHCCCCCCCLNIVTFS